MDFISNSVQETERFAQELVKQLSPGDVIALQGDLGAGKTAFTRGLAQGLGICERVTSPTYTIVNEYLSGRLPLFHFDMYRLQSAEELFDIGWDDYLQRGGICAVEWSEKVASELGATLTVRLSKDETDPDKRIITVTGGPAEC